MRGLVASVELLHQYEHRSKDETLQLVCEECEGKQRRSMAPSRFVAGGREEAEEQLATPIQPPNLRREAAAFLGFPAAHPVKQVSPAALLHELS
jgi:hypothetical protein